MAQSERTKGRIRAPLKGQPSKAPRPKYMIPLAVWVGLERKEERAKVLVTMAKEEGRKAVLAWKNPGVVTTARR